jgi:hypothetical protein
LQRDQQLVVRVLPRGRLSLRFQHTNHGELNAAHADWLSDQGGGIFNAKLFQDGRPNHRDALLPFVFALGEHAPNVQLILAHFEVVRRRSHNLCAGVSAEILHLQLSVHFRLHTTQHGRLRSKRFRITDAQAGTVRFRGDATGRHLPRADGQECGSEGGNSVIDGTLRTSTNAVHGDDRTHADHNAQHGEQGTQLVGAQRTQRNPKHFTRHHGCTLRTVP